MKALTLILRGARFYWRTHLGVVLGAALATMVLTGSLLTGDAVKATLRRQAELRVGKVEMALTSGDRFFSESLGYSEQSAGVGVPAVWSAPVLTLRATVTRADGGARVNTAQLLGVQELFWKQSPGHTQVAIPHDGVALNARLASQLGVTVGDALIIRVEKPGKFSRDAPLSGSENEQAVLRVKFAHMLNDEDFGRFALNASQVPPFTACVPLADLQKQLGLQGKANLLLVTALRDSGTRVPRTISGVWQKFRDLAKPRASIADPETIRKRRQGGLLASLGTDDLALEIRALKDGAIELRTPRVFLDPPVVGAAPRGKDDRRVDALTYFVNELRAGEKATPYSMVTAVETAASGFLPAELADGEMVISQWLADDLGIGAGGEVTVKYFVMGERRELVEQARKFTVLAVLPMDEPQLNSSWMPDFPGLADKKNCRDWKPGFAFDATRMREKDQAYWEKYRGTPKAFVNLKVGQEMWGNRWGKVTAMRWPAGTDRAGIERELRAKLSPEQLGFQFIPLRAQALAATDAPVDFGQLFVYFSFFLIAAAAVLTGMLFTFSLDQRNAEAGLLLALGLRVRQVRRLFLCEGAVLALVGSGLGAAGALLYTRLVLRALATVWRGAVGTTEFVFVAKPGTLVIGVVAGVAVAVLAMWWASRRQLRRSARGLLSGEAGEDTNCHPELVEGPLTFPRAVAGGEPLSPATSAREKLAVLRLRSAPLRMTVWWREALAVLYVLAAVGMVFLSTASEGHFSAAGFFVAGAFLLIAGLLLAEAILRRSVEAVTPGLDSLAQLGVRNAARRRGRSVGIIAVLASGVFMVVAVDAFRQRPAGETTQRFTGTGGFALVGESALPIYDDLNTAKGREVFALDEQIMEGVSVVPMRVRDGDDASCLNLNRALQPRVLGVKDEDLQWRFWFAAKLNESDPGSFDWNMLDGFGVEAPQDGAVPGIVDANTLQWALKKRLGDKLEYHGERGGAFSVRVVATLSGSLLQGSVLISEKHFVEKFPGIGGYRFFLIDCPPEKVVAVREHLSRQLADRGLELTPAGQRLAEFQAVENTYLSIFQALGGLGLLLGSAGLAIVVARNVLERRAEFGLLEAVGFRRGQLRALVFAEHRWLIACGLAIGTASAVVAVWPGLRERADGFPYAEMTLLLGGLTLGCVFWAWVATRLALRGSGVAALRSE
ncbi:MAG: FtsX-like permease family protein [Chthoniobacter sp.]|nr:FtsX-like permease family protein [Chthoniobacter sp.]